MTTYLSKSFRILETGKPIWFNKDNVIAVVEGASEGTCVLTTNGEIHLMEDVKVVAEELCSITYP